MRGTPKPSHPILLVDDEAEALESFALALEFIGLNNVITCQDERRVMDILAGQDIDVVMLDMVMPHLSGERLLGEIILRHPDVPVILATGTDDIPTAIRCIRTGAFDYLTKPVDREQLGTSIRRAIEHRELKRTNDLLMHHILTGSLKHPEAFAGIITRDATMQALFKYCEAIAVGNEPVLITGETGVGKELFARAVHASAGRPGEFVGVNVAGLDDHAFSDTLFGHRKGAFTGANEARKGLLEKAACGTIFLDEIGDLGEQLQIKLLRVLQDREFYPLGSDHPRPVEARFVVATNKSIETLAGKAQFRQDLYYRLRTHHIHIPALRERLEDIPLLLEHFLEEASAQFGKPKPAYPRELPQLLKTHAYPGNIRELRSIVLDAVGRHTARMMSMEVFREHIQESTAEGTGGQTPDQERIFAHLTPLPTLKETAGALVAEAMLRAGNNQRLAASMLGISPPALNKRLKNL